MPRKIVRWWVYPQDEGYSARQLAELLIEEERYHEEALCSDGVPRPMWWCVRTELEMFELRVKGNSKCVYTVYEEDKFGVRRPRDNDTDLRLLDRAGTPEKPKLRYKRTG